MRKFIAVTISFIAIWVIISYGFAASHEHVHEIIFDSYGYESNTSVWFNWINFEFDGICIAEHKRSDWDKMASDHNLNDIVGYHLRWAIKAIILSAYLSLIHI